MTEPGSTGSIEFSKAKFYRIASWACLLTALAHAIATLSTVYVVRTGNLGDFSPLKILRFIPDHILWWRIDLFSAAFAALSFLSFTAAIREIVDRRIQPYMTLALVLAAVGCCQALNGVFSMMVLFSDLAYQLHVQASFLRADVTQLAWATMNQSMTQAILVANSLFAICGFIIVGSILADRTLPKWLAWVGLPIWIAGTNVSILAFTGNLPWAMVLTLATTIAFVMWTVSMGIVLRTMSHYL